MSNQNKKNLFGWSQSELTVYLSLLKNNPINGSQLSKLSAIPRTRIYDILRSMKQKGIVMELVNGQYVPLPQEELLKRFRQLYESELEGLEKQFQDARGTTDGNYVWTITGYSDVMAKSKEMIISAQKELYVQLFPEEARKLDSYLQEAEQRGVLIKYVSMGPPQTVFDLQVVHPQSDQIEDQHQGRIFDVVKDNVEVLVGLFKKNQEEQTSINWAKNHWFVRAVREGIRHDFFHYFLDKTYDQGLELTKKEEKIYQIIKKDVWRSLLP